jgi:hypothetical protein
VIQILKSYHFHPLVNGFKVQEVASELLEVIISALEEVSAT